MRLIDADALAARYMGTPPDYYHTTQIVGEITAAPTVKQDQFTEWFEKWSLTPETADQMVLNFSEFLCYMTGGMLSAIGYDLQTMKTAADDYQSRSYSEYYSECAQSAGWTSVKDRVPEIGALCLVYDGAQMIVARYVRNGMWITPGMSRAVTHWMPLPETPEED